MLWQALVGIYPGQIVAFCYALVVWTCCWLITMSSGRRAFLLRLSTSGLLGLALATPKYLPLVWLHSRGFSSVDTMAAGLTTLASVVLPPEGLSGSNDGSMSAFYIPAALLIFLPVIDRGAQCFWPSLGALGTAVVLGLPFLPTYRLSLPGLELSRFQMNDFRAVFILSMILLGATGAQRAMTTREPLARRLFVAAAVVVGSTAWLALTTSAIHGGAGLVVAATAGAAACGAPFLAARRLISPLTGWFILIGSVAFSGGTFALLSVSDWGNDRVRTEVFHYGQTAETLVARAAEDLVDRRPPRWLPPAKSKPGLEEPLLDTAGNAAVYAHQYATYGYTNLRNSDTVAAMTAAYHDPARRESFLTFYGAPGAIAPVSKDTIGPMDSSCLASGSCAGLHFESTRYEAGEMTFSVLSDTGGAIAVNEAYYPGWHARVCATGRGSECREAPVRRGPMGSIVLPVPRGASSFTLTYTTPGLDMGRVIFWGGLATIALTLALPRPREESRYAVGSPRHTGSRSCQRAEPARATSVAVVLRLVRAGDVDAEVLGLLLGELGELDPERVEVQLGDLLVEVLGQRLDLRRRPPRRRTRRSSLNSSIWAIVWFENELDMTNDGWPVALPRFIRRPSDSTMIESPSSKVHSCTCGLISCFVMPGTFARPAMSISLSKWPMLARIALFFICCMCSAVTTLKQPVEVTMMSALSTTDSSLATW